MKTDLRRQRSVKTRALILETFTQLMRSKAPAQITVRELASLAGIHHSTFYYHFEDINALLRGYEDSVLAELQGNITTALKAIGQSSYAEITQNLISAIIRDHGEDIRLLLSRPETQFRQRFEQLFHTALASQLAENGLQPTPKTNLLAHYIIGAHVSVISAWVANSRGIDAAEVGEMLQQAAQDGLLPLLLAPPSGH